MPLLYKYLPPDRATFLDDGLLRMSQPGDLNDPFECLAFHVTFNLRSLTAKQFDQRVTEMHLNLVLPKSTLKALRQKTIEQQCTASVALEFAESCYISFVEYLDRIFGVISFSRNWSSSTMWAHYADVHQGLCIGIEQQNHPLPSDNEQICCGTFYDVSYVKKRIAQRSVGPVNAEARFLFMKSKDWAYEDEVRVIFRIKTANVCLETKSKRGFNVYLKRFPQHAVKELLLGYYASDGLKAKALAFARANHIPAFVMKLSPDPDFAMHREPLN